VFVGKILFTFLLSVILIFVLDCLVVYVRKFLRGR
jgi:hypothetical protein